MIYVGRIKAIMNSQLIYTSFDFVKDGFFAALPVKTLLAIHLFF